MTLTYYFGEYDEKEFEYEPNYEEVNSFIDEQPNEVIADAAEEAFGNMSEQERSEIITDILNSGDVDLLTKHQDGTNVKYSVDWNAAVEQDRSWVMQFFDAEEYFKDELHDYFHRAASDAYDECEAERRDPYGYRGISERDFY